MRVMTWPRLCVMAVVSVLVSACASPPRGFDSPEPAARMDAIVEAARQNNRGAVPRIVPLLESDDPATRLLAIRTLEQLEGETLGYDYAASESAREAAVTRWRRYVASSARWEGANGRAPGGSEHP